MTRLYACLIFGVASAILLPAGGSAAERMTVGEAIRNVKVVEIPPDPYPVERTVAEAFLKSAPPGAHIARAGTEAASRAGVFRIRVERGREDTSAGWFRFKISSDGSGELTASHAHILYAALCRVLEEWFADDLRIHSEGTRVPFRVRWLEGNDGLFVGVPRFIRSYDPESTIREIARLGCSHVSVNVLAATSAAEQGVPGEIYPRFYVYSPDLDQFVETDLTRGLYPAEYLQANLDLLKKNAALAVAYGLTPGLTVCSPRTMPEAFFVKYPYLRGARVDHPFRSYLPRYTATLSHPLVRWHYAQLMRQVMHEVPSLGFLTLWTNDSGSGFEYVSTLYAGRNGGAYLIREWKSDESIAEAAGENVVRYLRLLRDAASETNPRFRVITSLFRFAKERTAILNGLGDRLDLQVQPGDTLDAAGLGALRPGMKEPPALYGAARAATNFVLGVPSPWLTRERLGGVISPVVPNIAVTFDPPSLAPWSVNREVIRAWQTGDPAPVDTIVERVARRWCGGDTAAALIRSWRLADSAVRAFPDVPLYGDSWAFPWYRHWVRPFVPDIAALPLKEREYYEKHMIATFNNPTLIDFGADALWLIMSRARGASIVGRSDSLVWSPLDRAILTLESAGGFREGRWGSGGVIRDQRDRLVALRCYFRTLRNIAGWVAGVHGYIESRSPEGKELMLRSVRETIDDEVKNAGELLALWNSTRVEFMPVASQGENWALYGRNFGDLLAKKIELMRRHRSDTPAIDPDFMWRVGPDSPVSPADYMKY